MVSILRNALIKRVHLGWLKPPAWLVGTVVPMLLLAVGLAATAFSSGQAVGPVLSGSITGSTGVTTEQAIVLGTCTVLVHGGLDDSLCQVGPQSTTFTSAIEMHRGEPVVLSLQVQNVSEVDAAAILELSVPTSIDVEVEDSNNASNQLREAQMTKTNWLLAIESTVEGVSDENLEITIRPRPDITPGFYTISARISQIAG